MFFLLISERLSFQLSTCEPKHLLTDNISLSKMVKESPTTIVTCNDDLITTLNHFYGHVRKCDKRRGKCISTNLNFKYAFKNIL